MSSELIDRKENCDWLKKEVCKIPKDTPCPKDCSFVDLKFDKDEIIKRMKKENDEIQKLKKDGLFKNRNKIKDIIMGIYILQKVLSDHFQYIEMKVIDKDLEKSYGFLKRFRK